MAKYTTRTKAISKHLEKSLSHSEIARLRDKQPKKKQKRSVRVLREYDKIIGRASSKGARHAQKAKREYVKRTKP